MNQYYFDYAAATPMSDGVLTAMQPYFQDAFYNPSAMYLAAQDVRKAVTQARISVASIVGAKASEIIFTAGGTESDNLAIHGVMRRFPGSKVAVSAIEHDAVLEPAGQYDHTIIPVKPDGSVDPADVERSIDDKTVLVSIMYANNEIGTIQPIAEISRRIKKIRAERTAAGNQLPLYLHTDACQAANYLHLLVSTLGVDMLTLNGGKIYGPKQTGILYVKTGVILEPQVLGGGQERNIRSGTENVPAIIGFAAALKEAQSKREEEAGRLGLLQQKFFSGLEERLPRARINGARSPRLANNIHITVPGQDNERLMMALDEKGIMVAAGSACSASSDEPSHVLRAIGLNDEEARASLRITMGRDTSEEAIEKLITTLTQLLLQP